MENVKILNIVYDVIEWFDYHVLVQNPDTAELFLVEYQNIDPASGIKYTEVSDSNVVSIRSWVLCQRNINTGSKPKSKNKKNLKNLRK